MAPQNVVWRSGAAYLILGRECEEPGSESGARSWPGGRGGLTRDTAGAGAGGEHLK